MTHQHQHQHQHLNLVGSAWRQLRREWKLPATGPLLWQTLVPGSLFTTLNSMQLLVSKQQLAAADCRDAVVILGYWRSGTTLLHELMCLDRRFTFPTTHACMNAHHFLMTEEAALAREGAAVQRPMDEMEVRASSPQEDEFALLSLGARSPYEALLVPSRLQEALKLADPRDLKPQELHHWRAVFMQFMRGVSVRGGGRPIILKSPTHGFRVDTLRELLPDARFVLIVRNPLTNFESVVRMWRRMVDLYAVAGAVPGDDEIREAVLADRPRFEAKLAAGTAGLPENRFAVVKYESLVANPLGEIEQLYAQLGLGDFAPVREAMAAETQRRKDYKAQGYPPKAPWRDRIATEWSAIFQRYGYAVSTGA